MAEAVGFEAPSTSEEKIKVPYVNQIKQSNIVKHDLNKSMTLKQGMAKDLISNPSSTYKDSYIKTLKNQGYDEAALTDWANSVEENKKTLEDNSAKLNSNPSDFDASYKTGIALLNLGNPDDAINMFNSTIANLPKSEEGTAQGIPVQNELAMNTPYKKAGSTNVANSFVGIGAALVQKKQYKDAVSYYEEALKNDPSSKEAHDGLAYAKYFLGDKEGSKVNQKESAKIAEENKKYEALGTQLGEETKQEVQQQKRSEEIGGIHDMLQSFATGYDPENKLGAIGWLNPIGKITSQIQRGALNGTQTINEGMQELSESQGDASKSIHGLVTAGTGVIETLFSTIPAAIAFNAGTDVIKQTVAKVPHLEWIGDAIDIPMAGLKTLATKLGIAPDEKSTLGQLVNAYDLILGGKLLHEAPKIKGKIIDGLESYKDALKMAADGELNQKEMDELKTYSGKINDNITINDIKDNAEKPLAKKIEAKIEAAPSKQAEAIPSLDKLQTELAEMQDAFEKLPEGEAKDMLYQQIDFKEQEIAEANRTDADRQLVEAKLNADNAVTAEDLTARIERLQEDKKNVPVVYKSVHDILDTQINELTQQRDAIQKQSTTGVLPREQNEAGVTGGERVGMGQGEQGTAPAEKGKTEQAQNEEVKAQAVEKPIVSKNAKELSKILEPSEAKLIENAHGDKAYNYINKDGVEVTLKEDEEGGYVNGQQVQADVHLDFIGNDTKRGEGLASKELDRIISEADKNNTSISLVVDSEQAIRGTKSKKGLNNQELKKWYQSKGFIFDKDSRYGYRPRITEDASVYKKSEYVAKKNEITTDNLEQHSSPQDLQEAFDQDRLKEGTFHEDGAGDVFKMEDGKLKEVKNVKYVPYEKDKSTDRVVFVDKLVYSELPEKTNIVGEKVKVENAPKGSHLNIGLLDGRTNRLMSHEEILSKLPKGVEVVSYKEVPAMEPTLSIETSRPLTDAEMIKLLDDTKQQAIPQIVEGEGILYDNKRGTKEGWGEFNPEYFVTQEGKNLTEAKAEKITPEEVKSEPLTPEEKSKYNTLQLKEAHGTLKENEKAQLEELKAKVNQKGLIEKTKAKINNVVAALKKVSPGLKVETHETPEAFAKAAEKAGGNAQESMVAGGFYDKATKTIHLNLEKIQSNTLFHEGIHPILNAIHAIDKKVIDRLFNQVLEAEKRAGKEGFYSKEFASQYEAEGQAKGEVTPLQKMEAVTEFIADVADGKIKVTERNFDKIKQIFVDMMKAVGVDLSGKIKTVGELKALADKISTGFEKGEEIRVRKGVGNKSILGIQYQKFGGYEKKGFEESDDYQKLKKLGYINEDFDIHTMQGKPVVVINPDNMITGKILTKEGKTILEGNGGIHFVSKFGDVWASSDKSTANTLTRYINEQRALDIKNGGDGTVHIVVTKGSLGKSLTSHNGAKGAMVVLEDFIDKGLIPLKDFRKALTEAGKKQGIDFDGRLDAKSIHEDISKKFFGVTDSSFRGRGFFVNDVISNLAKNSDAVHNNIEKIREELNSKALGRKITFGEAGMKDALGNLFADQMTEGVPNSHAYATIEVNSPVKVELGKHESYPFHIKQENGERPKLNILSKTEHIKEIANPIEGSTNLGSNQVGMAKASIKGEPSLQMQKPRQEITSLNINGKDVEVKETQPDVVNGFYSPLEKVISDSKFDKLPVKQWIEKFAKGEEAKWTGLTDWLSQQQGSVSKADIQQYLKDNRVSVVEVVKGELEVKPEFTSSQNEEGIWEIEEDGDYVGNIDDATSAEDAIEQYIFNNDREDVGDTKFSQYQLEGEKENYKEVLVTLPKKYDSIYNFNEVQIKEEGNFWSFFDKEGELITSYSKRTNPTKEGATSTFKQNFRVEKGGDFKSSHFEEPNILVHLRMNTRKDAQGNKVLFLEEVQSDWGQTGKKEGFSTPKNEAKKEELRAKIREIVSHQNNIGKDSYSYGYLEKEAQKLRTELRNIETEEAKTPSAPFVTDTNAWTKLGLKVALKEAVKQGADKIAWTTGEQQNNRYDLSQTIKNIDAKLDQTSASDNSPVYKITSKYKSGEETSGSYKESELEGVVGKELAEKIINNKGGKYEGIDLKVGGKGMKGFYGSPTEGSLGIVGNVAKSLFKQEPKTTEFEIGDKKKNVEVKTLEELSNANKNNKRLWIENKENGTIFRASFSEAKDALNKGYKVGYDYMSKDISTQHSIDVTPELKASVSQGQPLFQKPRKGTDLVESAGKRKEMTEDDKGNYLFFHYSDAKFNNLNPEKVGTHLATSRGESPLVKSSMLYTRPDRLEPNVPNRNGYIVKVAKDKVYDFNSDPLKLLPEAEKLFRKENGKDKAFDLNNQVAYVAKVASKEGYPVTVSDWNIKGTKALRAQTVEKLPVEKYQGVKEGTYNQIETNPKYENIKPNAKRKDIQYSKGEEDLNTIFGNAEATAKSHSIEKGLQELESSDYYKKQPKESQQELTEYFKERVGAEEKGTTIDKFNALDKIAEEFKKGNVTKEFRNQKKAIFEENPEIEHVEKYFSKITEQLKENKDFKKSSPECP